MDFYVDEAELLRVRGHLGFTHPGACFREVNNLKCARRSGVALHTKEDGKKRHISKGKGHQEESSLIIGYHGESFHLQRTNSIHEYKVPHTVHLVDKRLITYCLTSYEGLIYSSVCLFGCHLKKNNHTFVYYLTLFITWLIFSNQIVITYCHCNRIGVGLPSHSSRPSKELKTNKQTNDGNRENCWTNTFNHPNPQIYTRIRLR